MLQEYFINHFFRRLWAVLAVCMAIMLVVQGYEFITQMPTVSGATMSLSFFFMMPSWLGYVLPLAVYLTLVLVINYLYCHRQLLGMMSLGMSVKQLIRCFAPWLLILGCVTVVCYMFLAPVFQQYLQGHVQQYISKSLLSQLNGMQFHELHMAGQDMVFYFSKDSNDNISNVYALSIDGKDRQSWQVLHANKLIMKRHEVVLSDGEKWAYKGSDQEPWRNMQFSSYSMPHSLVSQAFNTEREYKIGDLWQNRLLAKHYAVQLNSRLMIPLMFVILSCVPFMLIKPSTRPSRYLIFTEAAGIYIYYLIALICCHGWIKKHGWSIIVVLYPHLSTLLFVFLWRVARRSFNRVRALS